MRPGDSNIVGSPLIYNIPCPKVQSRSPISFLDSPSLKVECLNPGAGLHRKLSNPSDPLYRHIVNSNPDILGLVETMSIKPSKIPHVPGYFRFFCPANHTGGVPSGGVLVLIKNDLKHKVSFVCKSRNVIWLRFKDLNTVWHFAFVYVRTAKEKHSL